MKLVCPGSEDRADIGEWYRAAMCTSRRPGLALKLASGSFVLMGTTLMGCCIGVPLQLKAGRDSGYARMRIAH